MNNVKTRTLVKIISFAAAVVIVLAGIAGMFYYKSSKTARSLEYQYLNSISNLSLYLENMDSDLTKAKYVSSPEMLNTITAKIWREAGFAKVALSTLPVEYLNLQNTNKLLSQIGDYCVSLSKEFADGTKITAKQSELVEKLHKYCKDILNEVLVLNDAVQTGSINLAEVINNSKNNMDKNEATPTLTNGFNELDESYESYPTLIYDGPFSDHILTKKPVLIEGKKEATRDEAKKTAAAAALVDISSLSSEEDESGKMPSYSFTGKDTSVNVTKNGGYLSYMLKSRSVASREISNNDALKKAESYLKKVVTDNLKTTYYEVSNNVMTVNYAGMQNGITLYTDLIKVSVAMDNGEILGFDARGYITNHAVRKNVTPKINLTTAKNHVSEALTVNSSSICIIPSSGQNEILCYEFKCVAKDKTNILVYINAQTGAEERVLILNIDENGQLTI